MAISCSLVPKPPHKAGFIPWFEMELVVDVPCLRKVSQVLAYWEFCLSEFLSLLKLFHFV